MDDIKIKLQPGVAIWRQEANFFAHPDGNSVFIFDVDSSNNIICSLINFETGQRKSVKTDLSLFLQPEGKWLDFFAVTRESKLFVLALRSTGNKKEELIFSLVVNNDGINFVDNELTGFNRKDYPYGSRFLVDENEQLYVLTFDNEIYESSASYEIAQVNINGSGKITKTILSSKISLDSCYFLPFIHSGNIFWLRFNGWFRQKRLDNKMMKASLLNSKTFVEITSNSTAYDDIKKADTLASQSGIEQTWSAPTVIGENAFFFSKNRDNAVFLNVLNCKNNRWNRIALNEGEHAAVRYNDLGEMSAQSRNGFLIYHVRCSQTTCTDKAHVYTVDVSNYEGSLHERGLYRSSGVKSQVRELLQTGLRNQTSENFHFTGEDAWDIETITSAVKAYLRYLREPLITLELRSHFINVAKMNDEMEHIVDYIHFYVYKLPENHLKMLTIVIKHLKKVAEASSSNLMTVRNLGTCFGPTILRSDEMNNDFLSCNCIVEILIANCDKIFDSEPTNNITLLHSPESVVDAPISLLEDTTDAAFSRSTWYLHQSDDQDDLSSTLRQAHTPLPAKRDSIISLNLNKRSSINSDSSPSFKRNQELIIKKNSANVTSHPHENIDYEIRQSDTLEKIAVEHDCTITELMKINNMTSRNVFSGMKISIPIRKFDSLKIDSDVPDVVEITRL